MKRHAWTGLLALFFLSMCVACGRAQEQEPTDVLSKERMAMLLLDIHFVEEKVHAVELPLDSLQALKQRLKQAVYKKHRISDTLYARSLEHYASKPRVMEQIYAIALDSLR